MEEEFEEVLPWSEVPNLMKMYEDDGMDRYSAYLFLELTHRWHLSYPECGYFVLCPDGKIDVYGTFFIVWLNHEGRVQLIFEDKNPDPAGIKSFLCRCIDLVCRKWRILNFGPIIERYWPVLEKVTSEKNLTKRMPGVYTCHYMDKEQAKKLPLHCPDNVYIAYLKEEDADLVNELWPHSFEKSDELIRAAIRRNGGIGVYLKENDGLISWGLHGPLNGPGNVQTVENHKKKGFGSLATAAITKFVAEKGLHPLFFVGEDNVPARNLYAKLGFKTSYRVQWCIWEKTNSM